MADAALQLDDFTTPLRASSMPLAFGCPGSVRRPSVPIREDSDAADLGTAFHEAIRSLVEGRGLDFDELGDVADRYHVEVGELRMLCARE